MTASGSKLRVAIIGKGNQAGVLRDLLQQRPDVSTLVYYPRETATDIPTTQNFSDVLAADAVVIASPTPTHFEYLGRLSTFPGCIFLEKPAVSTPAETAKFSGFFKKLFDHQSGEVWLFFADEK